MSLRPSLAGAVPASTAMVARAAFARGKHQSAREMKPVVAYYRVSAERQGRSGLGLNAQRDRRAQFVAGNGMDMAEAFTEVETGKGSDALDHRLQLAAALAAA